MKNSLLFPFSLIILTISCSPKIKTSIYQERAEVVYVERIPIFTLTEEMPAEAEVLGEISFDARFDFYCTTDYLIEELNKKAKSKGANALKIFNYFSNNEACPNVYAHLLYIEEVHKYQDKQYSLLQKEDKAIVHIYRMHDADITTRFVSYSLQINEGAEISMRRASKKTLVVDPGYITFTLNKTNYQFNKKLEAGETYFLKVHFDMIKGEYFKLPKLKLTEVDPLYGIIEFESFSNRHSKSYVYQNHYYYDQPSLAEDITLQAQLNNRFSDSKKPRAHNKHEMPNNAIELNQYADETFFEETELGREEILLEAYAKQNEVENKREFFRQMLIAYNPIPFQFNQENIIVNPGGLPAIEQQLQAIKTSFGLDFGFIYDPDKTFFFTYFNYAQTSSEDRGRDKIMGMNFGIGQRYFITPTNQHILSWGMGIGSESLRRELYNENDYLVELAHTSYTLSPYLRYEYNLPDTPINLFLQARYIYGFGTMNNFTGVFYTDHNSEREQDEITRFDLDSGAVNFTENRDSNFGNRLEFTFGITINM